MHRLALPAGASARLTATAKPELSQHRWQVLVRGFDGQLHATYGSRIGGRDLDQRVDIPARPEACSLEIESFHASDDAWIVDHLSVETSDSGEFRLGYCELTRAGSRHDDVVLSFVISGGAQGLERLNAPIDSEATP